ARLGRPEGGGSARDAAERRHPQVDELDGGAGSRVAVADPVRLVEGGVDLGEVDGAHRDVDAVLLTDVAHVGGAGGVLLAGPDALLGEELGALRLQLAEDGLEIGRLQIGERWEEVRHESVPKVVRKHPQAEKVPGLQGTITSPISS